MATNQVPNVNSSVLDSASTQRTQDIFEQQRQERDRARQKEQRQGRDEITIQSKKPGVAGSAEPAAPTVRTATAHEKIKTAQADLKKAFVEAGGNGGKAFDQSPETAAVDRLETLQNEIDALIEKGAPEAQVAKLEAQKEALANALSDFRDSLTMAEGEIAGVPAEQTVRTASSSEKAGEKAGEEAGADFRTVLTPEEQELWTQLDAQLKAAGVERSEGEVDVETIGKKFMTKIGAEFAELQGKEVGLTKKYNELLAQWKSTQKPEEKAGLEKSMKQIKDVLNQIGQRKIELQKMVTQFATASDALLSHQVSKELGLNAESQTKRSSRVTTASAAKTSAQAPAGTTSAKGGSGSQSGLSVQSATDGSPSSGGPEGQGPLLGTASEAGDSYVSPEAALARTAAFDNTGTTTAISTNLNNQRGEARRIDNLIRKLIMAAQSGNMEAVVSGLLFLGKRQNILTTSMGAQTLVAMQQYEKQMGIISNQIGALKPSPDYSSKLAKLNADMSIYSSSRQMITQTFRDFLNAKEQVDELAHSVIGKLGQLGSRLASFQ